MRREATSRRISHADNMTSRSSISLMNAYIIDIYVSKTDWRATWHVMTIALNS